jgi:NAD(P)-dependent dehydrogenase (short-subunit alcohol dehydrogenase family)
MSGQPEVARRLSQLSDLSDRVALLAGGAGHLGRAAGEALVELGAVVAVCDRDPAQCEQRAQELSGIGPGRAVPIACDLADEGAIRRAVHETDAAAGPLDLLVHCAALVGTTALEGWAVPFERQGVAAWDAALRINVTSAFVLAQEAQPMLSRRGRGAIVLFSSIYGLVGPDWSLYEGTSMANPAAYGASKAALLGLVRTLATSFAPTVRTNAISPGGIWRAQPQSFVQRYQQRTPLRRMATEEDLKGAVAYLSSDLSAYVTGHNLVVDGGWTAW